MALNLTLRKSYLYIFAVVGLVLCIISLVSLINLGLKTYVFTKADYPCYNAPQVADKTGTISQAELDRQAEENTKNCEESRTASKQSQAANAIAMIIVGLPLYTYHWHMIRKENQI